MTIETILMSLMRILREGLAKSFIVLGDSFAEREEFEQAKATFESVRDGYEPSGPDDDVIDDVTMRLKKMESIISQQEQN